LPQRDRAYYAELVGLYGAPLYRFAYRLSGGRETAEDLVQETFCEAWRSLGTLRNEQNARGWLFQILRHRYAHLVRDSRRKTAATISLNEDAAAAPAAGSPLESLARRELLQSAIDRLDDHYKQPFLMVFLQGLTCQETAEELNLPLGTVLSRLHRARELLRGHLRRMSPDGLMVDIESMPESNE